jgi:FtsP/CotA-like multicopper oxidase with cupredoxin domain
MIKKILLVASLLLLPTLAQAQTVTQTLEYDYLATTSAVVSGYTQTIKINASPVTSFSPTCVAAGANTHCTFPLPSPGVKSGDVVTVTATNGAGSTPSVPYTYNPGSVPTAPTSVVITITIKVP